MSAVGAGINSPPITYTHRGRQFVTVLSGVGGAVNRRMKGYDLIPAGVGDDVRVIAELTGRCQFGML
jgi:hypothetical protein